MISKWMDAWKGHGHSRHFKPQLCAVSPRPPVSGPVRTAVERRLRRRGGERSDLSHHLEGDSHSAQLCGAPKPAPHLPSRSEIRTGDVWIVMSPPHRGIPTSDRLSTRRVPAPLCSPCVGHRTGLGRRQSTLPESCGPGGQCRDVVQGEREKRDGQAGRGTPPFIIPPNSSYPQPHP